MVIITLAAATEKWEEPHGFPALLAGVLRQRGVRTLLFDLAPAVFRLSDRLARPAVGRETTFLPGTGLHLLRPVDGLMVLLPGAAGPAAAAATLGQVREFAREGQYGAMLICCAADQGDWVAGVLQSGDHLVVLADADPGHVRSLARNLSVGETPRSLVVLAHREPGEDRLSQPAAMAAHLGMPLLTALLPGTGPELAEREARVVLERILRAPAASVPDPGEAPHPVAEVPARATAPSPAQAVEAPARAPVRAAEAAARAPTPAAAGAPSRTAERPPAAPAPGAPPAAATPPGPAATLVVPAASLPLLEAALGAWRVAERARDRARQVAEVTAALRRAAGSLQQRLDPGHPDDADLPDVFDTVMRLRTELRQLQTQGAGDADEYAALVAMVHQFLPTLPQTEGPVA